MCLLDFLSPARCPGPGVRGVMMSIPADGLDGRPSAAARPVIQDLGFARLDLDRDDRTGDPEVLFAAGKTPGEVVTILASLNEAHPGRAVLATRCTDPA